MTKIFILYFIFASFIGLLTAADCNCSEKYRPVCASKDGVYETFYNDCEASCSGFLIILKTRCFPLMNEITACSAHCSSIISPVCALKGGETKKKSNFVNECFANCSNATNLTNGFCLRKKKRNLSLVENLAKKINKLIKSNITEKWIEDNSSVKEEGLAWHKIGDEWESCNCTPLNNILQWVRNTMNDTIDLNSLTQTELQLLITNTVQGFNEFKNKTAERWAKLKRATLEGFKRFSNKSQKFFAKVSKFIKNVTLQSSKWLITQESSFLGANATWWHKTKKGIEKCTCCFVEETEEALNEIHRAAGNFLNQTQKIISEFKNSLITNLISFRNKTEENLIDRKKIFQSLWPCICSNNYDPVCVETSAGEQATVLNQCFSDCAKNELKTVFNGTCVEFAS